MAFLTYLLFWVVNFLKPETLDEDCYHNFCAGQKYKGFSKFIKMNFETLTLFSTFYSLNNFLAKNGSTGAIGGVQTFL